VSKPGEIREEYEAMVAIELQEAAHRKSQEEMASNQLLQKYQVRNKYSI